MIFPTIVYKCPGNHQCPGNTYSYKPAEDARELDALLEAGWFLTLPEALNGEHDEGRFEKDDSAPTREELEQMGHELELKFDGRTSDAKLAKMISEKLEA